jgi:2-(1,2-epoxy-1,2-dihydrophenyl)acetyl-CoA isomerase
LYFLSETIGSAEAERIGLVSRVFADEAFRREVGAIAGRLAAAAPIALRNIKANLNEGERLGFMDTMMREAERHVRAGATEDAREAGRAFLEKRPPVFQGR